MKAIFLNWLSPQFLTYWRLTFPVGIFLLAYLVSFKLLAKDPYQITYLYNSGWIIETRRDILLIDYVPADEYQLDSVVYHKFRKAIGQGKRAYILITHEHADHFYTSLLHWRSKLTNLTIILGWDYALSDASILTMHGRDSLSVPGLKVVSHPSTDAGSGFLLSIDQLVIYHAGDHAAWSSDLAENFEKETRFIRNATRQIDIAFIPIAGGKMGDCKVTESITRGSLQAVRILQPLMVFPMHLQCDNFSPYKEFSEHVSKQYPSVIVNIPKAYNEVFAF